MKAQKEKKPTAKELAKLLDDCVLSSGPNSGHLLAHIGVDSITGRAIVNTVQRCFRTGLLK